jgi:hypothetical protein
MMSATFIYDDYEKDYLLNTEGQSKFMLWIPLKHHKVERFKIGKKWYLGITRKKVINRQDEAKR